MNLRESSYVGASQLPVGHTDRKVPITLSPLPFKSLLPFLLQRYQLHHIINCLQLIRASGLAVQLSQTPLYSISARRMLELLTQRTFTSKIINGVTFCPTYKLHIVERPPPRTLCQGNQGQRPRCLRTWLFLFCNLNQG